MLLPGEYSRIREGPESALCMTMEFEIRREERGGGETGRECSKWIIALSEILLSNLLEKFHLWNKLRNLSHLIA